MRGEAADWLSLYLENNPNPDYVAWKTELKRTFQEELDTERLRKKLTNLKQNQNQKVRAFSSRLDGLYDTLHGKARTIAATDTEQIRSLIEELQKRRDEDKKKIFLKGLNAHIRQELWPRIKPIDTYNEVVTAACTAESILVSKDISDGKSIDELIASISTNQQNQLLEKQQKELDDLRTQMNLLIGKIGDSHPERKTARSFSHDHARSSSSNRRFSQPQRDRSYSNTRSASNSRDINDDVKPREKIGNAISPQGYNSRSRVPYRYQNQHTNFNQNNRPRSKSRNNEFNHQARGRDTTPYRQNKKVDFQRNFRNRQPYHPDNNTIVQRTYANKPRITCQRCDKIGHIAAECRSRPPNRPQYFH